MTHRRRSSPTRARSGRDSSSARSSRIEAEEGAARPERESAPPGLPQFRQAENRTLRDHVYMQMRKALMTGRFESGQKLTIRGLAEALGVSPTPIREAVGRLAAEGALTLVPNRWIRVPRLTSSDLRELRDLRLMLEGYATEQAVAKMTEEQVTELRRLDAEIAVCRQAQDVRGMIPLIAQFHLTLYAACRLPTLLRIIESLWVRSGPHINLVFRGYAQAERGKLRARTLEAIARRDAAAARQSLLADIGNAADYILALIEKEEQEGTRDAAAHDSSESRGQ